MNVTGYFICYSFILFFFILEFFRVPNPIVANPPWEFIKVRISTGTPSYIALGFIKLHICCTFYKWKARLSTSEKVTCYIVTFTLLQWSGTKPATSLRYVSVCGFCLNWTMRESGVTPGDRSENTKTRDWFSHTLGLEHLQETHQKYSVVEIRFGLSILFLYIYKHYSIILYLSFFPTLLLRMLMADNVIIYSIDNTMSRRGCNWRGVNIPSNGCSSWEFCSLLLRVGEHVVSIRIAT